MEDIIPNICSCQVHPLCVLCAKRSGSLCLPKSAIFTGCTIVLSKLFSKCMTQLIWLAEKMLINHHILLFISHSLYSLHENYVLVMTSINALLSLKKNKKKKQPSLFKSLNIDFFSPPCRIKPNSIEHCRTKFNTIDQSQQRFGGKRGTLPSCLLSTAITSDQKGKKEDSGIETQCYECPPLPSASSWPPSLYFSHIPSVRVTPDGVTFQKRYFSSITPAAVLTLLNIAKVNRIWCGGKRKLGQGALLSHKSAAEASTAQSWNSKGCRNLVSSVQSILSIMPVAGCSWQTLALWLFL